MEQLEPLDIDGWIAKPRFQKLHSFWHALGAIGLKSSWDMSYQPYSFTAPNISIFIRIYQAFAEIKSKTFEIFLESFFYLLIQFLSSHAAALAHPAE